MKLGDSITKKKCFTFLVFDLTLSQINEITLFKTIK